MTEDSSKKQFRGKTFRKNRARRWSREATGTVQNGEAPHEKDIVESDGGSLPKPAATVQTEGDERFEAISLVDDRRTQRAEPSSRITSKRGIRRTGDMNKGHEDNHLLIDAVQKRRGSSVLSSRGRKRIEQISPKSLYPSEDNSCGTSVAKREPLEELNKSTELDVSGAGDELLHDALQKLTYTAAQLRSRMSCKSSKHPVQFFDDSAVDCGSIALDSQTDASDGVKIASVSHSVLQIPVDTSACSLNSDNVLTENGAESDTAVREASKSSTMPDDILLEDRDHAGSLLFPAQGKRKRVEPEGAGNETSVVKKKRSKRRSRVRRVHSSPVKQINKVVANIAAVPCVSSPLRVPLSKISSVTSKDDLEMDKRSAAEEQLVGSRGAANKSRKRPAASEVKPPANVPHHGRVNLFSKRKRERRIADEKRRRVSFISERHADKASASAADTFSAVLDANQNQAGDTIPLDHHVDITDLKTKSEVVTVITNAALCSDSQQLKLKEAQLNGSTACRVNSMLQEQIVEPFVQDSKRLMRSPLLNPGDESTTCGLTCSELASKDLNVSRVIYLSVIFNIYSSLMRLAGSSLHVASAHFSLV